MKQIITGLAAILFSSAIHAQEFGIEVGRGMQGLQYKVANGTRGLGIGNSFGVNYTYALNKHWGITSGIAAGAYNTEVVLQNGKYATPLINELGSAFVYNVQTSGYSETQRFWTAGIPLLLHYHTPITNDGLLDWYADAGGKILFPFSPSVKASAAQLTTSGYYPDYNITVHDVPLHGFGTVTGWTGNVAQTFKPAATLGFATGIGVKTSNRSKLYIGMYADFGLNDAVKTDAVSGGEAPVTYSPTNVNIIQSAGILNTTNVTGRGKLLGFGMQVKIAPSIVRRKK